MPHVAIFLATAYKTHRLLLKGILRFVHLHTPWILHVEEGRYDEYRLRRLGKWGCTGIICCDPAPAARLAAFARRVSIPMIVETDVVNGHVPGGRFVIGQITCDDIPIGRAAADYFLRAGFKAFAFVSEVSGKDWSTARGRVYVQTLAEAGFPCSVYAPVSEAERGDAAIGQRKLAQWLKALPKPIALFAAYDVRARQVLDACLLEGIAVPEEVAILGVDDEEVYCETALPPISSIPRDCEEAGIEAARLLDEAMRTHVFPRQTEIITYTGRQVIERRSTQPQRIGDASVRRCLELVALNLGFPLRVNDLALQLGVSRRTLEMRVKAATGRTLEETILQTRLQKARTLLRETDMTASEIAEACGFCDASYFGVAFKRAEGVSPRAYRSR